MADWNGFGGLDLSGVEADAGRASLRPGNYECVIREATIKDTKDGRGKGLIIVLADVGGEGTVEDFINLKNSNADAERIGLQRLKAILTFGGHPNPDRPGDVGSIKGLTLGVRVEQGDDWTDRDGNVKPGGGKVKRSGAYFKVTGNEKLGVSASAAAPKAQTTASRGAFNDEIPF